jgi:ubiquinone/menaquinone biosynthesis C-methylase UbiE
MIYQRKTGSHRVVKAFAEKLPFENASFLRAMTVLSIHHWENRELAFSEINRVVTEKFVAITWNPKSVPFWLTRDYFPEIYELDTCIFWM